MPLNESHIEEAALEWLAELGYALSATGLIFHLESRQSSGIHSAR